MPGNIFHFYVGDVSKKSDDNKERRHQNRLKEFQDMILRR